VYSYRYAAVFIVLPHLLVYMRPQAALEGQGFKQKFLGALH
jgi:hypothetical protein